MAIRAANLSDIEKVLEVVLSAAPYDPQWDYRFPYRKKYPEEHLKYTKLLIECFLDQTWDDWQVMVVEAPSLEDCNVTTIVSISVWDVSFRNRRKHGQEYIPQNPMEPVLKAGGATRKDANLEHVAAFRKAVNDAKAEYFGPLLKGDQMHLQMLATHSDYLCHGFATGLVKWGMSLGKNDTLKVNLLAGPMGFPLYTHLEFKNCGKVFVQMPDEEEKVTIHAMEYDCKEKREDVAEL